MKTNVVPNMQVNNTSQMQNVTELGTDELTLQLCNDFNQILVKDIHESGSAVRIGLTKHLKKKKKKK